jgi:hypothetical protein
MAWAKGWDDGKHMFTVYAVLEHKIAKLQIIQVCQG